MKDSIRMIAVPTVPAALPTDRLGGEAHGVAALVTSIANDVSVQRLSENFTEVMEKVRRVVGSLKSGVEGYEIEEITIGLAVTGEGTIGIATAGVEASIEVCLKRKSQNDTR